MFHYALNPNGYLILGSSESIGAFADFFTPVHPRHRIFAKRSMPPGSSLPLTRLDGSFDRATLPQLRDEPARTFDPQREADRFLLDKFGPPSVLVNEELTIVQFRGRTGDFLEPAPGAASFNLLRMAREGLMVAIHAAIRDSSVRGLPTRKAGVPFKGRGGIARVDIQVIPIVGPGDRRERFHLVLFENLSDKTQGLPPSPAPAGGQVAGDAAEDERVTLRQELAATKDYLQSMTESQESFNEELRSANEEILSANEELQSTNEELETAKEELQSANEELTTLNEELQIRNEALAKANDDLTNLLNSIEVAVVILDAELRVRRFTAAAGKLMNLIPTDIGRPFTHINPRIVLPDVADVMRDVVDKLVTREFEVQDPDHRWYSVSVRPYKTVENRIDGALLTVMDIDSSKRSVGRARDMREYRDAITEIVDTPVAVLDGELRVRRINQAFTRAFDVTAAQAAGQLLTELGSGSLGHGKLRTMLGEPAGSIRTETLELDLPRGGPRAVKVSVCRLAASELSGDAVLVGFDV